MLTADLILKSQKLQRRAGTRTGNGHKPRFRQSFGSYASACSQKTNQPPASGNSTRLRIVEKIDKHTGEKAFVYKPI